MIACLANGNQQPATTALPVATYYVLPADKAAAASLHPLFINVSSYVKAVRRGGVGLSSRFVTGQPSRLTLSSQSKLGECTCACRVNSEHVTMQFHLAHATPEVGSKLQMT